MGYMLSTEDGPMCIAVINTSSCVMMFSTFFFEYVHEIVICFLFVMYMTKFQCLQFFFFKGGGGSTGQPGVRGQSYDWIIRGVFSFITIMPLIPP